ncbi:heparinase II/III family protein [Thalassotalea sp. LPB0316]|uniref:heparinase II/III domain-containing protein n=1 Tax=Thalassotalea sp. LPB0316 TaxID=2769490 RepID=UPI0018689557|nr:heparinase II/III family protein [Thalassotalea sp. LPB0316]QOL24413.1 heparinase II/III family protein [Thalassotalea sp. LPB0316]
MNNTDFNSLKLQHFSGNCKCEIYSDNVLVSFSGEAGVHSFTYNFTESNIVNRFNIELELIDWESIDYLAVGVELDGKFEHIKINHVRQETKFNVSFSTSDLFFLIQNKKQKSAFELSKLKVFVKGKLSKQGSQIVWSNLTVFEKAPHTLTVDQFDMSGPVEEFLFEHMKKCFRDYTDYAETLLTHGCYPMPGGKKLNWKINEKYPEGISDVNTFRFSWHAMHAAICLMIYARENRDTEALYLAKSLITSWLNDHYFQQTDDVKFAWYDHGTSERLISFLMLLSFGSAVRFDKRFNDQLLDAISQHCELLAHEGFYAYNQREIYHNHAWFQDIALMLSSLCFASIKQSEHWEKVAVFRLQDQIDKLIVRDNGYSIFVENSIGYHQGIQRICLFAGQLASLSKIKNDIADVSVELDKWSAFLRYPNGRSPSQGDTFRLDSLIGENIFQGKAYPEVKEVVLQKAGYAVSKGNIDEIPYMFCFFSTALSQTHKHEDNLSFTFFFDGIEWFIDPSFYSHEYEQPIPKFLRSAWAHNTVAIENEEFSIAPGKTAITKFVNKEQVLKINAFSDGYPTRVERRVELKLQQSKFNLVDKVDNKDCNAFQMFHLGHKVNSVVDGKKITLSHPDSKYCIVMTVDSISKIEKVIDFDEERLINAISGLGFMATEETSVLAIPINGTEAKVEFEIIANVNL